MTTDIQLETEPRGFWSRHRRWLLPLMLCDVVALLLWLRLAPHEIPVATEIVLPDIQPLPAEVAPPISQLVALVFPTAQNLCADPLTPGLLQPTASGNPESGQFGSVRTTASRRGMTARFHEGVDIASVERDRRSRPTDVVHAIAPGTVAYVNKVAGNSDYGRYVVLSHADDVGSVYSLYGHLASIEHGIHVGVAAVAGQAIGLMGNSSVTPIPMDRAHLHFEIGLLLNPNYDRWVVRSREKRPGGCYNGLNLFGVDPLDVFRHASAGAPFNFKDYLGTAPEAFRLVFRTLAPPLFFSAHPLLWDSSQPASSAVVVSVAESGLPLRGWYATPGEVATLGSDSTYVLSMNAATLNRNGRHYIAQRNGHWMLTVPGEQWLQILTFRP